jgi:polysaccharide chain length determinant protein (PEP-CTERM system associated)
MLGHRTLNVEDYLTILKRRWWIIAIPTIILPIIAIVITFFIPPKYISETLVLIDQQKVPDEFVRSVVSENLDSRLASMKEQILSRSQLQPIIEKYNLYADQHMTMDGRIELARKSIEIQPIHSEISGSGGLPGFKIFFTASDPHTAQQVCAEITSLFTGANLRQRQQAAEGTTEFLKQELDEAKRTLDDQDAKLAAFQSQYFGMQPSDEANNVSVLTTLRSQLDATTQAISQLEQTKQINVALLAQQPQATTTSTGAVVQSPQVQQKELDALFARKADLETRYSSDYPDVREVNREIANLQKEMAAAPVAPLPATPASPSINPADTARAQQIKFSIQAIDLQIQNKQKEQEQIQQQIRSYQARIIATPQVEEQYKQLTRGAETSLALYNSLLAQTQQAKEATELENRQEGESFRLLDESNLPESPSWPKQSVFAGGGFAAGLTLGLLIVALLEYKDTALRTERDVWDFTQLPTLAIIAWSGDVADLQLSKFSRLKRIFSRKPSKELIADSSG